ncbi:hypothetical protein E1301_Tti003869 [Triplophysa tibetana]|uniref:Uncharacterized protein n=1 Tax=Triplophysa tibetana TaxID=1572043 RepID=A0A5A9PU88_9TELE|nr:hypothetical protein E1301_Tti003869 [Triplophysa tibetana]
MQHGRTHGKPHVYHEAEMATHSLESSRINLDVRLHETQRAKRSRQPAESVCVMNHGVPTTMCVNHKPTSPT